MNRNHAFKVGYFFFYSLSCAEIRHDFLFCKEGCDNLAKFPSENKCQELLLQASALPA